MSLILPKISFKEVSLGYLENPPVIESLTGTLEGPGMFRLLGPNGSGKSTLLEAIAGHLPLRSGRLFVCGREAVQGRQESVVYIRTTPALARNVTMRDHCLLFAGRTRSGIEKISQLTADLGIQKYLDHISSQLSSGTRRKFWLSLGLLRTTPVLLLDEPFNELDDMSATWLFNYLMAESKTRLVVIVCHTWPAEWPIGEAQYLTDRISVSKIPTLSHVSERRNEI